MSILIMSQVWEHSAQEGGALLVLLALADFANEAGESWPSLGTLGRKARLGERQTRYVLRALEEAGEIRVKVQGGPRGCNLYTVTLGGQSSAGGHKLPGGKRLPGEGAVERREGGQSDSPKPSGTIKEPSSGHQSALVAELEDDDMKGKRTRIPEDFRLTPEMAAWAAENCPAVNAQHATEEFVDYWQHRKGSGGMKQYWDRTWRNRMRAKQERAELSQRQGRYGTNGTTRRAGAFASIPGNEWMGR